MTDHAVNIAYLWGGIVVGLLAIISGSLAAWRAANKAGVRNDKLDALIHPQTGVLAKLGELDDRIRHSDEVKLHRLDQQDRKIEGLQRSLRPNGLNTDLPGDMMKRVEISVSKLVEDFSEHKESCDRSHEEIWVELDRKSNRRR